MIADSRFLHAESSDRLDDLAQSIASLTALVVALREDNAALRDDVAAIARTEEMAAITSAGVVSLERFAEFVGVAVRTLKNDLLSSDPLLRLKWPEFKKRKGTHVYLTTGDAVRHWITQGDGRGWKSTHFDPEVARALASALGGRR